MEFLKKLNLTIGEKDSLIKAIKRFIIRFSNVKINLEWGLHSYLEKQDLWDVDIKQNQIMTIVELIAQKPILISQVIDCVSLLEITLQN